MKVFLLMMMGGSGTRLGADIPKQYLEVAGKPVFMHIIKEYSTVDIIDGTVVVSNADWIDFVKDEISKNSVNRVIDVVAGGETRSESVYNGLKALKEYADEDDIVLIDAVTEFGGATLGGFEYDTMYEMDENTNVIKKVIPRREVVSGASPEAFNFNKLFSIYENASKEELQEMTSAGAIALANGIEMKVIQAGFLNLKITYPRDLDLFKLLVSNYFFCE